MTMRHKKAAVKRFLRQRVRQGYAPKHTMDSAEDHCCDWLALSEAEFDEIVESVVSGRKRHSANGLADSRLL